MGLLRNTMMSVAALGLAAGSVNAQDAQPQMQQASAQLNECAQNSDNALSFDEANKLSNKCLVIYYGENVSPWSAEGEARSLRNVRGLTVTAASGFANPDKIMLLSQGQFVGNGLYSEDDLHGGIVGADIKKEFGVTPAQAQADAEEPLSLALAGE